MPTFASLVQSARRGLALWLLPEIHELLQQKIDDETSAAGQPDTERIEKPVDTGSGFAAPRPEPPADWVARVREGAPQLLIGEAEGGVPSVHYDDLVSARTPAMAEPQHTNPPAKIYSRQGRTQMPSMDTVPREASPVYPPGAEVTSHPARTGPSRIDAARQRIASAIHSVAHALAGKDALASSQKPHPGVESPTKARPSASEVNRQNQEARGFRVRSFPPEPDLMTRKERARETREQMEDSTIAHVSESPRKRESYKAIPPQEKKLRPSVLPSAGGSEEHVVRQVERARQGTLPMQPKTPRDVLPLSAPLNVRRESPVSRELESSTADDGPEMPPHLPRQNRRFTELPDNFAAMSRATGELQPYSASVPPSPSIADQPPVTRQLRTSPRNRWPALIAPQRRQRESVQEGLQAHQRQARLNMEQTGVD